MSLAAATEALYEAFAGYGLPARVEGCPCCVDEADQLRLHAAPLRLLEGEDLRYYAFSAPSTWGTGADFRHFLPRLLELASQDALGADGEILLGKLRYDGWEPGWPAAEREAVRAFLLAWWADLLADGPERAGVEELLAGIGAATDEVEPFLATWARAIAGPPLAPELAPVLAQGPSPGLAPALAVELPPVPVVTNATHHFVSFTERGWSGLGPNLTNPFWPPEPKRKVLAWLASDELKLALQQAFQRTWDAPDFEAHARLFDRIAWFH